MNRSNSSPRTGNAPLSPRKPRGILLLPLLLAGSLFLASCSKSSDTSYQAEESTTGTSTGTVEPSTGAGSKAAAPSDEVVSETGIPVTSKEKAVLGVIKIQGGAMLERDIIPQLCKVFSLSEDTVKKTMTAANSTMLINTGLSDFRRMEGMILPGEYVITEGSSLEESVSSWVLEAEKRYSMLLSSNTSANSLTPAQQLSLASIIESECLANAHHEEVAAVFLNRLARGSRLQSCVTAEYALGYQRPYLLNNDVTVKSSYNTYYVTGLPPGPICAVSDASLKAAMGNSMYTQIYYFYYDYILNDMFFFADYEKFRKECAVSRKLFESKSSVGTHEKINKQSLYSKGTAEGIN